MDGTFPAAFRHLVSCFAYLVEPVIKNGCSTSAVEAAVSGAEGVFSEFGFLCCRWCQRLGRNSKLGP